MNIPPPSKKIATLLTLVILIVIGSISYSVYQDQEQKRNDSNTLTFDDDLDINDLVVGIATTNGDDDTDGDGLRDWEEELWNTDPNLADTDGDGTNDGDEVTFSRNPIRSGPNDELSPDNDRASILLEQRDVYEEYREGSLTDQLSKDLLTDYADLKNEGLYGGGQGDVLVDKIINDTEKQIEYLRPYTINSFKTFASEDPTLLRAFGNLAADMHIELLRKVYNAGENINDLSPVSDIYRSHAAELGDATVPALLVGTYSELANDYTTLADIILYTEQYRNDPAKSLIALKQLGNLQNNLINYNTDIANYLSSRGILFTENESGILWTVLQ